MTFRVDFLGALAFNGRAIRALGARGMVGVGAACYCAGVLVYGLVRRAVYADLPEVIGSPSGMTGLWHDLDLVPAWPSYSWFTCPPSLPWPTSWRATGPVFLLRKEWRAHAAVLLPLWGAVCFIAAPVQWLVPHFLIAGYVDISFGVLVRSLLLAVTTFRAVGSLNRLSPGATTGTLLLSALTLPVYLLMSLYARVLLFVLFASAAVWALAAFRARRVLRAPHGASGETSTP